MEEDAETLFASLNCKMGVIKEQVHKVADEYAACAIRVLTDAENRVASGTDEHLVKSLENAVEKRNTRISESKAKRDAQLFDVNLMFSHLCKRENETFLHNRKLVRWRLFRRLSERRRQLVHEAHKLDLSGVVAAEINCNFCTRGEAFVRHVLAQELTAPGQWKLEQRFLNERYNLNGKGNSPSPPAINTRPNLRRRGRPSSSQSNASTVSDGFPFEIDPVQAAAAARDLQFDSNGEPVFRMADEVPVGGRSPVPFLEQTAGLVCSTRSSSCSQLSVHDSANGEICRRGNLLRVRKRLHAWPDTTVSTASALDDDDFDAQLDLNRFSSEGAKRTRAQEKHISSRKRSCEFFGKHLAKHSHVFIVTPPFVDSLSSQQVDDDFYLLKNGVDGRVRVPKAFLALQEYRESNGIEGPLPELTDLMPSGADPSSVADSLADDELLMSEESTAFSEPQTDSDYVEAPNSKRPKKAAQYKRVRHLGIRVGRPKAEDTSASVPTPLKSLERNLTDSISLQSSNASNTVRRGRGRPPRSNGLRVVSAGASNVKAQRASVQDKLSGETETVPDRVGPVTSHVRAIYESVSSRSKQQPDVPVAAGLDVGNLAPQSDVKGAPFGYHSYDAEKERPDSTSVAISSLKDAQSSGNRMASSIGSFLAFHSTPSDSSTLPATSQIMLTAATASSPQVASGVADAPPYFGENSSQRLSGGSLRYRLPLQKGPVYAAIHQPLSQMPPDSNTATQEIYKIQQQQHQYQSTPYSVMSAPQSLPTMYTALPTLNPPQAFALAPHSSTLPMIINPTEPRDHVPDSGLGLQVSQQQRQHPAQTHYMPYNGAGGFRLTRNVEKPA